MNTSTLPRHSLLPQPPPGMGLGAVLALLAHGLLIAALAFGVSWRTSEPPVVQAELWAAVPTQAAPLSVPATVEPTPQVAPPPQPPAPPPQATPEPQAEVPDASIAREQAKKEERARKAQQQREEAKQKELERKQALAAQRTENQRAEKLRLEKELQQLKAEEKQLAAQREANLKRLLNQAGSGPGGEAGGTGTAAQTAAPSAGYAGRINGRIRPNIVFTEILTTNPVAEVELRLAPDGRIVSQRLITSSGVKAWDDAVLRAIERTEVLPRDVDGRVPSPIVIAFRPRD